MGDPGDFLREKLQLAARAEMLRGSVVSYRRKCGKPSCVCAEDVRRRHPSLFLTVRLDGRTRTLHVRKADEAKVRKLVANYVELKGAVEEVTRYEVSKLSRQASDRRRMQKRRSR